MDKLHLSPPQQRRCSTRISKTTATVTKNPSSSSEIRFPAKKIRKLNPRISTIEPQKTLLKIGIPLSSNGEIDVAIQHLRISDPLLQTLIDAYRPPTFDSSNSPFLALTRSILYQQLATKAAKAIYTRFTSLCGGEAGVSPDSVLALSEQQLRGIGVSGRKASYIHDLASKYKSGALSDSAVLEMTDEMLLRELTLVKGIGVWSVHMFMIFNLHRPDVLPVGDLGVRKGVKLLYGLRELPKPLEMEVLCDKWKPFRSVGAWYMWRLVEANAATPAVVVVSPQVAVAGEDLDDNGQVRIV